jgi:hypothetical protein
MESDLATKLANVSTDEKLKISDFGELSPAERKFLDACTAGHRAIIGNTRPEAATLDNTIRSTFIRFLAIGRDPEIVIHENGIELEGAWFDGELDLRGCVVGTRLAIISSTLDKGARLTDAQLRGLHLQGCQVAGIEGQRVHCNGGIFLSSGFHARGEVNLIAAKVTGDLNCDGGHFENVGAVALNLDGVEIDGRLFLRQGFHASGGVSLAEAKITSVVRCQDSNFDNAGKVAINCDRANIGGGLFLGGGCRVNGGVTILGARITGDLACAGARFYNPGAIALHADGSEITGRVFLRNGLDAIGEVRFIAAKIRGEIDCSRGTFTNPDRIALNFSGAEIGRAFLTNSFRAAGTVTFGGATASGPLNCTGGRCYSPRRDALVLSGAKLRSLHFGPSFHASGYIAMVGTHVAGDVECFGATFDNLNAIAINANRATIDGSLIFAAETRRGAKNNTVVAGGVTLVGTKIGGDLDCHGAMIGNAGADALNCDGINVGGRTFLSHDFKARGTVRFVGAKIAKEFLCMGGRFESAGRDALNCAFAAFGALVNLCDGFHAAGRVALRGVRIEGDLDCTGGTFDNASGRAFECDGGSIGGRLLFCNIRALAGSISLENCHAASLEDDLRSWQRATQLILDGFRYDRLSGDAPTKATDRLAWLDAQRPDHLGENFRAQPWDHLIRVLRDMGHSSDSRTVAVAKQLRLRRAGKIQGIRRLVHVLYGWSYGFGYRPLQLAGWVAGGVLFFAIIFWFAAAQGVMVPTDRRVLDDPQLKECQRALAVNWAQCAPLQLKYTAFNPLLYSLELIVPVIGVQLSKDWSPQLKQSCSAVDALGICWSAWRPVSGRSEISAAQVATGWWPLGVATAVLARVEILFGWLGGLMLLAVASGFVKKD